MALRVDAQVGGGAVGGQVGSAQLQGATPAIDPIALPIWAITTPDLISRWRRNTLDSFVRGPEFPQPTLAPSTRPWAIALAPDPTPLWRRYTSDSTAIGPPFAQPSVDPSALGFGVTSDQRWNQIIPPWRRRTQASVVVGALPAFNAAQQLQLFLQGINHRAIGTPRLTGGVQQMQAFIRHGDTSAMLLVETSKITKQLNTTGTAEYKLLMDVADSFRPVLGDSVQLIEFNKTRFSGFIDERDYTVYPGSSKIEFLCKAVDWNGLCQRRRVTKDYQPGKLLSIVSDICLFFLNGEHIDPSGVDPTITVDEPIAGGYKKVSDVFNELALSTNTIWWIDSYKVLHFILAANAVASSFSISDNGMQVDSIQVTDSLANYRNKQYVRTNTNILGEAVTLTESHTFSGAPADEVCITSYPLTSQPESVKENGVELVGTDRLFELVVGGTTNYPAGGEGWYWAKGFNGVFHWPSNVVPTAGLVLAVSYTGVSTYAGNVVVYADPTEIAAMAAATGGSGLFEELEDYSGSATYSQALALAKGIVQGTAPVPKQFVCSTIEEIEDVGRKVTINLAQYGISGDFIIQGISQQSLAVDLGKGTTFRTQLTLVSARTLGNFIQYFERLMAKLAKAATIAPTEKPTWTLAFNSPGNVSPGLTVGTFDAPYPVQVGLGRILRVTAVFNEAADADIVLDILLNGVSIFDGAKLRYPAGTAGVVKTYGNLSQVNVKSGDQFILEVLSCGTINPGKNGTVIVEVGPRT